ncbi:MAG: hypothetical protein WAN12_09260 [Candidatus Acidiferrum sp.]
MSEAYIKAAGVHNDFTAEAPLRPEAIAGKDGPRGMVPVRRAGANVTKAFWAKLAGHYGAH